MSELDFDRGLTPEQEQELWRTSVLRISPRMLGISSRGQSDARTTFITSDEIFPSDDAADRSNRPRISRIVVPERSGHNHG